MLFLVIRMLDFFDFRSCEVIFFKIFMLIEKYIFKLYFLMLLFLGDIDIYSLINRMYKLVLRKCFIERGIFKFYLD